MCWSLCCNGCICLHIWRAVLWLECFCILCTMRNVFWSQHPEERRPGFSCRNFHFAELVIREFSSRICFLADNHIKQTQIKALTCVYAEYLPSLGFLLCHQHSWALDMRFRIRLYVITLADAGTPHVRISLVFGAVFKIIDGVECGAGKAGLNESVIYAML